MMKLARTLLPAALLAATACSSDLGGTDLTVMDPAQVPPAVDAPGSPEQALSDLRRAQEDSLSDAEAQTIRDYLIKHGVRADQIAFEGRLVAQEGDMLSFADDVLAAAAQSDSIEAGTVREKGRVFSALNSQPAFAFCVPPLSPCPIVPVDIADPSGQNLLWIRPDTTIKYYLVTPSGAPAYLSTLLGLAAARLTGVQSGTLDCLDSSLFEVISSANYNALPAATKNSTYVITFVIGSFSQICTGGGRACSVGPLRQTVTVGTQPQSRLRFGHIIGLPNSPDQVGEPDGIADDTSNESVGMVVHELLHAMGLAHVSDTAAAVVPGTQQSGGADQTQSIMVPDAQAIVPNWKDWSSASNTPVLDKTMLSKLYGGSCGFSTGFRTISP